MENKYIKPWGYIGYNILFNIPVVGFILLIVFSFDKTNLNRKYFAIYVLIRDILLFILGFILTYFAYDLF